MSKNVGFPVMSTMISGLFFVLGALLATLGILVGSMLPTLGLTNTLLIEGILFFIGLFFFLWGLLSFSLNPDLEDYQRNVAFLFAALVVVILFHYGIQFVVTVG